MPERVPNVEPGTVVAVADAERDELLPVVVLTHGEDAVTVVPISERAELATDWDLLLPEAVLGYEAIAEVWNYGSVLAEQLDEVLARLDGEFLDGLRALARVAVSGGVPASAGPVGPPVLGDDDPRLLFQDAEAERARPFWEPALALAGSLTLGQLVAHRRGELEIPSADLEALAGSAGWLEPLERDELDVRRALPAAALAGLMRRLRLRPSLRLGRIAAFTLETQAGASSGAALARGGGSDAAADDVPPIDEYVDAFLRSLADE